MISSRERKTEAQRKWRAKYPEKQQELNKRYLPRNTAKYVERYRGEEEFRKKEQERQREYYAENREKILSRIRRRKMMRKIRSIS